MNQLRDYRLYVAIMLMIPIIASYAMRDPINPPSDYEILDVVQLATNDTYGQGYADYHKIWIDHYQASWDESIDYNSWCKHSQQVAKYDPKDAYKHYMMFIELQGYPRNNEYEKFGGYYNPETTIFYKKNGKPCKNNDPLTTRCRARYLITKVMNVPVAASNNL